MGRGEHEVGAAAGGGSGAGDPGSLVQRFRAAVDRDPGALALVAGELRLTYGELEARAERLARELLAAGVEHETLVGVRLDRSADLVVAVLGIIIAGAAYLPLDPEYPADRLRFMLQDAGVGIVVTSVAYGGTSPDVAEWVLEEGRAAAPLASSDRVERRGGARSLAYVMYTSGSTGVPKGVLIEQRSIVRLVCDTDYARFGPGERFLLFAPASFDASTLEIWGPLLNGGALVVAPAGLPSLGALGSVLRQGGVTAMWLTSALFHAMVDDHLEDLRGLRQILAGGDVLSPERVARVLDALPECAVINGYGPTENTTFTCCFPMHHGDPVGATVPIGRPIPGTTVHLLDPEGRAVADGQPGELYTGGLGVARGYLGRPELTAERFLPDPFADAPDARMYRTGDLARRRPDGVIEFLGRIDGQMKVRGYRIEPGEVEAALRAHPAVRDAVAGATTWRGEKHLTAWIVPPHGQAAPDLAELRRFLGARVPAHLIPTRLVALDELPVTPNGKVDRQALPEPAEVRGLGAGAPPQRPGSGARVAALFAELLGLDGVPGDVSFFDLGGTSLLAMRLVERLEQQLSRRVPVVTLFDHPTADALEAWLGSDPSAAGPDPVLAAQLRRQRRTGAGAQEAIAIVGMACRYPGAADVRGYWRLLIEGRETTRFFEPGELDPGVDPAEVADAHYVAARGVLDDADAFDAAFFGMTPRLAELTDPQNRVFLETCWEALEDAGYDPARFDGLIGVWGGKVYNSYRPAAIDPRPELLEQVGALQLRLRNEKDYLPIWVAHALDLRGPAVAVQTACSTSLVAVVNACFALQTGQCDMALAGGAAVTAPIRSGHLYVSGGMLSRDGHTRPFDASATGTVFSDGVGVVTLKRLSDAERDGDTIHAVIRGMALNNDGAHRASFSAPNVEGQSAVVAMALARAGWDADTVQYVEAHGTATPLGDPIEVAALTRAFRQWTERSGFCGLGSVKGNFGHTTAAAGVAGLIKTALAIEHGVLPKSLNFQRANPEIEFEMTPFIVQSQPAEWALPRRAGVSSFGVGGTNAHVVLEAFERANDPVRPSRPQQLVMLSARTASALDAASARLAEHLRSAPQTSLADAAYTLAMGRRAFAHRRIVVAADSAEAAALLETQAPLRTASGTAPEQAPEIVYMLPGQGSQSPGMARAIYDEEPLFRQTLDACAEIARARGGIDLLGAMYPPEGADAAEAAEALRDTSLTQPAIFAVELGLARLWTSWGVRADALVGHSVGEFVAACVAGVMEVEDALGLVLERGRLMSGLPRGGMMSVRASAEALVPLLGPELALACENAPELSVVAGPDAALQALAGELGAAGIAARPLHTSHAFHSAMMDPVVEPLRALAARVRLSPPRIPIASTVTGTWLSDAEATDPGYWAAQARATVRFSAALRTACRDASPRLLLEVGPRVTTTTFARQTRAALGPTTIVASLDTDAAGGDAWIALQAARGRVWLAGVDLDLGAWYAAESRRRVPLPTYPFERRRHWLEPVASRPVGPGAASRDVERMLEMQLEILSTQMRLIREE
ncbi:MAG: amino acid adenylation domain-containing protein [Deltaproteobacteria bacterium]|nr:amino acid adenylation domain-containing protein [Deltaproteobacteria bacterium]